MLDNIDVHLVTPYTSLLDVPFADRQHAPHIERFGITVHHGATVDSSTLARTRSATGGYLG